MHATATRRAGSTLRASVPLFAYLALAAGAPAQEPVLDLTHENAGGIVAYRQALLDAAADRRVLVVATHPDDPYRGICAALRRHVGDRVRVLLATRGEGGQSAVGPVGEELGEVRTAESREAARRLDVELRFLDLPDFGYSRTAAEALERWRGLEPERRLREEVVAFDPDLVVTPHGPQEAHGQKRALFHLLRGALAGEGAPPLLRAPASAEEADLVLELDRLDPLRGESLREVAYETLLLHRSQGPFEAMDDAIPAVVPLRFEDPAGKGDWVARLGGEVAPTGDAAAWRAAVAGRRPGIEAEVDALVAWLDGLRDGHGPFRFVEDCRRLWPLVDELLAALPAASDAHARLAETRVDLCRGILEGGGVRLTWRSPGVLDDRLEALPSELSVTNASRAPLSVELVGLEGVGGRDLDPGAGLPMAVPPGRRAVRTLTLRQRGAPGGAFAPVLRLRLSFGELAFPVRLHGRLPLQSGIELRPEPYDRFLVPVGLGEFRFSLRLRASPLNRIDGELAMTGPLGARFLPESDRDPLPIRLRLGGGLEETLLSLRVRLPDVEDQRRNPYWLRFYLVDAGDGHELVACRVQVLPAEVGVPEGLRLGLIRGPDPTIERSLESLLGRVDALDPVRLARLDLDAFDTILVASRALLRRPDLRAQVHRLLAWARRGGHLVVLYHKDREFNRADTGALLAPLPLVLGRERVTREDAPVKLLLPQHRLLGIPNRIRPSDWDDWVQERGLYFPEAGAYDAGYEELLEIRELPVEEVPALREAGEPERFEPQRGSLLAATTGRGSYVYCALVLHRQLQGHHAGAARILANLVTPPRWDRFR